MGTSTCYRCRHCGFESGDVLVGVGMMGVEQLPASCRAHRGMTTLSRQDPAFPHLMELSESDRTRCRECGAAPVLLEGTEPWLCPDCGELQLEEAPVISASYGTRRTPLMMRER